MKVLVPKSGTVDDLTVAVSKLTGADKRKVYALAIQWIEYRIMRLLLRYLLQFDGRVAKWLERLIAERNIDCSSQILGS